jgi:hypothetical protein
MQKEAQVKIDNEVIKADKDTDDLLKGTAII